MKQFQQQKLREASVHFRDWYFWNILGTREIILNLCSDRSTRFLLIFFSLSFVHILCCTHEICLPKHTISTEAIFDYLCFRHPLQFQLSLLAPPSKSLTYIQYIISGCGRIQLEVVSEWCTRGLIRNERCIISSTIWLLFSQRFSFFSHFSRSFWNYSIFFEGLLIPKIQNFVNVHILFSILLNLARWYLRTWCTCVLLHSIKLFGKNCSYA